MLSSSCCSLSWEVLGSENLLRPQASLSPPTLSITTLSPSPHTFFSWLPSQNAIGGISRPFLFSQFPLLGLPSPAHPAGFSFCNFTGFLAILKVVTSTTTTRVGFFFQSCRKINICHYFRACELQLCWIIFVFAHEFHQSIIIIVNLILISMSPSIASLCPQ